MEETTGAGTGARYLILLCSCQRGAGKVAEGGEGRVDSDRGRRTQNKTAARRRMQDLVDPHGFGRLEGTKFPSRLKPPERVDPRE